MKTMLQGTVGDGRGRQGTVGDGRGRQGTAGDKKRDGRSRAALPPSICISVYRLLPSPTVRFHGSSSNAKNPPPPVPLTRSTRSTRLIVFPSTVMLTR